MNKHNHLLIRSSYELVMPDVTVKSNESSIVTSRDLSLDSLVKSNDSLVTSSEHLCNTSLLAMVSNDSLPVTNHSFAKVTQVILLC